MIFKVVFKRLNKKGLIVESSSKHAFYIIERSDIPTGEYRRLFEQAFRDLGMQYDCQDFANVLTVELPAFYTNKTLATIPSVNILNARKETTIDYMLREARKQLKGVEV